MACNNCSCLRLRVGEAFGDSATRTDCVERTVEVTTCKQKSQMLGLYQLVDHLGNGLNDFCSDRPPTEGEQDLAGCQAGHRRCHRLRLCEQRCLQLRWGGLQDGEDVEGRRGSWNNSRSSVECGCQWKKRLGLGLLVVEDGLHAVIRYCHQVCLLVCHRLEYCGATEIHWDLDCFERGDGGEEGARVCDQLGFRRAWLDGWSGSSKKATSQDT